jgi:hypothetical protein
MPRWDGIPNLGLQAPAFGTATPSEPSECPKWPKWPSNPVFRRFSGRASPARPPVRGRYAQVRNGLGDFQEKNQIKGNNLVAESGRRDHLKGIGWGTRPWPIFDRVLRRTKPKLSKSPFPSVFSNRESFPGEPFPDDVSRPPRSYDGYQRPPEYSRRIPERASEA